MTTFQAKKFNSYLIRCIGICSIRWKSWCKTKFSFKIRSLNPNPKGIMVLAADDVMSLTADDVMSLTLTSPSPSPCRARHLCLILDVDVRQSLKVGVDVILSVCRRAFKSGACATQCICLNLFRRLILGPDEDDDSIGHCIGMRACPSLGANCNSIM